MLFRRLVICYHFLFWCFLYTLLGNLLCESTEPLSFHNILNFYPTRLFFLLFILFLYWCFFYNLLGNLLCKSTELLSCTTRIFFLLFILFLYFFLIIGFNHPNWRFNSFFGFNLIRY